MKAFDEIHSLMELVFNKTEDMINRIVRNSIKKRYCLPEFSFHDLFFQAVEEKQRKGRHKILACNRHLARSYRHNNKKIKDEKYFIVYPEF